jgi:hypothetical protein
MKVAERPGSGVRGRGNKDARSRRRFQNNHPVRCAPSPPRPRRGAFGPAGARPQVVGPGNEKMSHVWNSCGKMWPVFGRRTRAVESKGRSLIKR